MTQKGYTRHNYLIESATRAAIVSVGISGPVSVFCGIGAFVFVTQFVPESQLDKNWLVPLMYALTMIGWRMAFGYIYHMIFSLTYHSDYLEDERYYYASKIPPTPIVKNIKREYLARKNGFSLDKNTKSDEESE